MRHFVRLSILIGLFSLLINTAAKAAEVLPDLDQEAPWEMGVAGDTSDGTQHWHLGFNSAVDNLGKGPLIIKGHRDSTDTPQMTADQWINTSDGKQVQVPAIGKMQFVSFPTHNHWHFLGFDSYQLREIKNHTLVRPDSKTGFCLGDRYKTYDDHTIPGQPAAPVFTEGCGFNSPQLLEVGEGMSPGYGDNYAAQLEGQYIDITGVAAGTYNLVHTVNANKAIHESNYTNNSASLLIKLDWPNGTSQAPTVKLLDVCQNGDECGSEAPKPLPKLTNSSAASLARSAARKAYGSSASKAVASSCKRTKAKTGATCKIKWTKGSLKYSGSVSLGYQYGTNGVVQWFYNVSVARNGKKQKVKSGHANVKSATKPYTVPYVGTKTAKLALCPLLARSTASPAGRPKL